MKKYDHKKIERKWQREWERQRLYRARENSGKPKYYQLETFPYPSAAGLHVGHPRGYIAEDIQARYQRMHGREVLYTIGWDAFGLPTENYALKIGKSPQTVARTNVRNFKRQIKLLGSSYDWQREINTAEPEYYRWTQWLFLQLYKAGLAYKAKALVNWCPSCLTVLANEQVVDGRCERCERQVIQKEKEQWFFRITAYAERLLAGLKGLDWPAETIKRQQDWLGRSEGALIKFQITNSKFPACGTGRQIPKAKFKIEVFTTRPDTLFGATYLVLAPEHEFVASFLKNPNHQSPITNKNEVEEYLEKTRGKTERQRKEEVGEKTGVELKGVKAVNPASKEEIPIWVADYVLLGYGTGAIMGVPAHDQRDYQFAKKFKLPIRAVVAGGELARSAYEGDGVLINSGRFSGLASKKAKWAITKFVGGAREVRYKLKDWSVSRQRYWGVPIPIIYCKRCGTVPVPEKDLPVKLPQLENYRPKGLPPLASSEKFMKTKCPKCGGEARRDPETLDTFVDSSWYYLRYPDPKNSRAFAAPKRLKHWLPVDLYIIGAEHVTAHLLYARFITKFLSDWGFLNFEEPFLKLRHQGMILGADGRRMSKRWGNVVNPDEIISRYGADTFRLYEMFLGPFEQTVVWQPESIMGVRRFLERAWKLRSKIRNKAKIKNPNILLNKTIKKVGEDIELMKFNTAVSALMILLNHWEKEPVVARSDYEQFLRLTAPFAPHLTEELWQALGHKISIHLTAWPKYDPTLLQSEERVIIIQVNGRVCDTVRLPQGSGEEEVVSLARQRPKVAKKLAGRAPKRTIYLQDKLINFVVE